MAAIRQNNAATPNIQPGTLCVRTPSPATAALSGNVQLGLATGNVIRLDPNGANRNVTLLDFDPRTNPCDGQSIEIWNAGSANNLVIKNEAGTTLVTVTPGIHAHAHCFAGTWYATL